MCQKNAQKIRGLTSSTELQVHKILPDAARPKTTPKSCTPESLVDTFKVNFFVRKNKFPLFKFRVELANALTASQPASSSNWIHLA